MLQTFRMIELGLSWRLDSTKEHSQRAFFSDDRSFGEFARLSKITLNIHHERCQRFNAYSTVNDCDFCDYTVTQKTVQNCFCQNFIKLPPILIVFGKTVAKRLKLCEVHSFSTSPNSRHRTTVLNADVPN